MKICILSTGRAGSTSLFNVIKAHLSSDYYSICEPFNLKFDRVVKIDESQYNYIQKFENSLIKSIVFQNPPEIEHEAYHDWLFSYFDKIILLDRRDKKLQSESFAYHIHTKQIDWHLIKKRYKLSNIPKEFMDEINERVEGSTTEIDEIAKTYNKKVYYYEDIFIEHNLDLIKEIFDEINITINDDLINKWIISNERKVRIDDKVTKLI